MHTNGVNEMQCALKISCVNFVNVCESMFLVSFTINVKYDINIGFNFICIMIPSIINVNVKLIIVTSNILVMYMFSFGKCLCNIITV